MTRPTPLRVGLVAALAVCLQAARAIGAPQLAPAAASFADDFEGSPGAHWEISRAATFRPILTTTSTSGARSTRSIGSTSPAIAYAPQALLTSWEVIGPLAANADEIGRRPESGSRTWRPFAVDERGAVVTARVTDFHGPNSVAYFRALVSSATAGDATLHLSTIDDLALWVNGRFSWFISRDTAAWYDFSTNAKDAGQKIPITLHAGTNAIVPRARGGSYATGGFFARLQLASR